ncbi:two-component system sensor histidine kinase QseC [Acinetobacter calcoaceticus]|uniref:histidine kinase n=1 Tax=Acinetobacter calcoaceticus TaxID=471 RepID=A0A4R1XSH7_ACICA|nr:two-component system sensor histidine kinase QseC [Acinetobacter calcoaceticus]
MQQRPVSLQQRLIKHAMLSSICAGVLALLLLLGFSAYHNMQTQDDIMDEISDMLLVTDISAGAQPVDELSDEFNIAYQLSLGQQVLTQSPAFPQQIADQHTFATHDEFSITWRDGRLWRSYQYLDHERQLQVRLYQPISERFDELLSSMWLYSLCLLLLWLLQWLLLHFAVKKQFRSIHRLSQDIAEKNAEDLSPIQQQAAFIELQPMVKQLNLMLLRVQQSLLAEQRLTADASHELRSPLSAIQMRLQVLRRKYAGQLTAVNDELNLIQQDVQRGTQVLENLLLLARLDPTDQDALAMQSFDLRVLVLEVIQALAIFAEQKQVTFHDFAADQSTDLPDQAWMIVGNRELLMICIRNLLDNAIRYAKVQGSVYIQFERLQHSTLLSIEDDGEQLTAEVLAHMGERFYRALGTQTQGSGLGLSICKKIIQLHQDQLQFSPSTYGGLKVKLIFTDRPDR